MLVVCHYSCQVKSWELPFHCYLKEHMKLACPHSESLESKHDVQNVITW